MNGYTTISIRIPVAALARLRETMVAAGAFTDDETELGIAAERGIDLAIAEYTDIDTPHN